jgi:hypothetical protein
MNLDQQPRKTPVQFPILPATRLDRAYTVVRATAKTLKGVVPETSPAA